VRDHRLLEGLDPGHRVERSGIVGTAPFIAAMISRAVMTARTPGSLSAAEASIARMRRARRPSGRSPRAACRRGAGRRCTAPAL